MPNWMGGANGAASGAGAGSTFGPWGTAIGGIAGGLAGLFDDPFGDASDEYEKAWQEAQGYEKPFWQNGLDQYEDLNKARQNLMNPAELENQWGSGYEQSPWAKRLLQMNQGEGLDAASSMGLMGSSGALANIQQGAGDITSKYRQQYMNDLMQKYMSGIGLGQSIYGTGAQAGTNLANQALGVGGGMGGAAYEGANQQHNQFSDLLSQLTNRGGGTAYGNQMPQYAKNSIYNNQNSGWLS